MKRIPRTEQILNMPIEAVNSMTEKQLKPLVQILASAANKRLARLRETEIGKISPAYISAMKRVYKGKQGGKFGTAGKDRNALLNEYKAVKTFLNMKTSSVDAWKKFRAKTYKKAGIEPTDDAEKEKAFWSAYRKIEEMFPNMKSMAYGSDTAQTDLRRVMNGKTVSSVISEINNHNLRNREFVIDQDGNTIQVSELPENDTYIIDGNGQLYAVDPDNPDDALKIMELKVDMEYEREQYSTADEEFFEL